MLNNSDQYEEISLVELVVLWLRSWKVAVVSGLLVTILAAAIVSMLTSKYDSKVNFKVSSLGEDFLVDPAVLVSQLKAKHRVGDDTQGERSLPRLESVSSDRRNKSPVITLTARSGSAQGAADFLNMLTQELIDSHKALYEKSRQEKIALYELLKMQKGDNGQVLAQIQRELSIMAPSALLSSPSLPIKPTSPKKPLLYAVSLVLGLMVMLVVPFLVSFVRSIRVELQRQVI